MIFTVVTMAALLAGPPPPSPAPAEMPALQCPHADGFIDRVFVPNAAIATAVYRAIRPGIDSGPNKAFPEIEVTDEGDHWEVMENREPTPAGAPTVDGSVMVERGGGQFYLRIDKCTGAISRAAYNR